MSDESMTVTVLGLAGHCFRVDRDFFQQHASRYHGQVVADPPPFIAPCTDGVVFIYNMLLGPMDVRGACIVLCKHQLETGDWKDSPLADVWRAAGKPMTMLDALARFQFPSPASELPQ